jgi:hypothetical protein
MSYRVENPLTVERAKGIILNWDGRKLDNKDKPKLKVYEILDRIGYNGNRNNAKEIEIAIYNYKEQHKPALINRV